MRLPSRAGASPLAIHLATLKQLCRRLIIIKRTVEGNNDAYYLTSGAFRIVNVGTYLHKQLENMIPIINEAFEYVYKNPSLLLISKRKI